MLSVLMTAFNREDYITEAIESVLSSTYKNIELIIVDDKSTDTTVKIIRQYQIKDERIKLFINEINIGDYPNRNKAVYNTLEQIVLFLPCLWLYSIFVDPKWGAILGAVWIVGRIAYAWGYYVEASKRAAGNAIASLATLALLFGTLFHLVRGVLYA